MKTAALMVILACAMRLSTTAQVSADAGTVTKVLALEHAWNQAVERKDINALAQILDDALVSVDYDGTLRTKAEFLAKVKAAHTHPQQEVAEEMTAHMFWNTVVVTGVYTSKGVENGKPYLRRGRFVDTWAFRDGAWLCVVSQATPLLH